MSEHKLGELIALHPVRHELEWRVAPVGALGAADVRAVRRKVVEGSVGPKQVVFKILRIDTRTHLGGRWPWDAVGNGTGCGELVGTVGNWAVFFILFATPINPIYSNIQHFSKHCKKVRNCTTHFGCIYCRTVSGASKDN